MAYALGCGLAPVIGGFLNDKTDFQTTCSIMGCIGLGLFVFYLFVGIIFHREKKDRGASVVSERYYPSKKPGTMPPSTILRI
jgi:hypothetical protein